MKITLIFLFFIINVGAYAQAEASEFSVPNYAAKSPEAASFLKYGEYPVDLSTGVPNISIPLYSIDVKGISVPITLTYHASGIKVTDEASWIGLGWNMSFGAQIIRNVRDEVDDDGIVNNIPSDASLSYYDVHPYAFNTGPILNEQLDKSRVKDEYRFSSPTANGTFVIGSEGMVVFPPDAFKVSYGPGGGFKITDTSGIVYYLNVQEISRKQTQGSSDYTSAWYVSKIETPNNDIINFSYVDDGQLEEKYTVQTQGLQETFTNCGCNGGGSIGKQETAVSTQTHRTFTQSKKIREITFNNGNAKVVFTGTTGRQDLINGNSKLSTIEIRQWNGSSFALQRGYALTQSYFNNSATGNLAYMQKRLQLTSVETLLEGDSHQFIYSNLSLPSKDSYSQDYYGYYNGKNNPDMIPVHTKDMYTLGHANRSVDPLVNQAGMLTKVYYPTKGWTEFSYETNNYWGINPLTQYELSTANCGAIGKGAGSSLPPDDTIPETAEGPSLPYETKCETCIQYSVCSIANAGTITVGVGNNLQPNESNLKLKYQYGRVRVFDANWVQQWDSGKSNSQFITPSVYLSGVAYIVVEAYGGNVQAWAKYTYAPGPGSPENVYAGGLRIKNIKNYDTDNTLLTEKEYNYTNPYDATKTSGALTNYLYTSYESYNSVNYNMAYCGSSGTGAGASFVTKYVVSSASRGRTEGNTIAYNYVKERLKNTKDNSQNGYTLYKFNTAGNALSEIPEIQYKANWKVGSLLEKTVFATRENIEVPIRQEVNTYAEDDNNVAIITGFKMVRRASTNVNEDPGAPLSTPPLLAIANCGVPTNVKNTVSFFKYSYIIPRYYLKSTMIIENSYNSQDQLSGSLSTLKTYNYNNPSHMQLSSEVTKNSVGETIEQRYFYPGDAEVASEPVISDLISKNILVPLKVQSYRNNIKLNEQLTKYRNWGNNILAPEFILGSKGSNTLENRVRFNSYDIRHGNPTEMQIETGSKISYIWAYDKSRPVAKIQNIGYDSIPQYLIDEIQSTSDTGTEILLATKLDNLRNNPALQTAMVETYTYRPLGGISIVKDVRGNKMTYSYDNQERLLEVRDQDDKIVKENKYHFKN